MGTTSLRSFRWFLLRFASVVLLGTALAAPSAWPAAVDLYAHYCGPLCDLPTYYPIFRFDSVTGTPLGSFATVVNPRALTFGPDGNLYASDVYTASVLRFDGTTGAPLGSIPVPNPQGLAFGPDGNLYVAGGQTGNIFRFHGVTGTPLGSFAGAVNPNDIAFGPDGNLYVTDVYTASVLLLDGKTGAPLASIPVVNPQGLAFGPDGNLYVSSVYTENILRFDGTTGAPLGSFASVVNPGTLAFGPDSNLYVVGRYAGGILRFDGTTGAPLGTFIENAGIFTFGPSAAIPEPTGLVLTAVELILVLLCLGHRQRRADSTKVYELRAGSDITVCAKLSPAYPCRTGSGKQTCHGR